MTYQELTSPLARELFFAYGAVLGQAQFVRSLKREGIAQELESIAIEIMGEIERIQEQYDKLIPGVPNEPRASRKAMEFWRSFKRGMLETG